MMKWDTARELAIILIGKRKVKKLEDHGIIVILSTDLKDLLADLDGLFTKEGR